jgi:dTDP-4-amino-4,6-dideoxygalactose transaminase
VRARDRERLQQALALRDIGTLIHYPTAPHLQGAYSNTELGRAHLPIAEDLASSVLSLPIGPHLRGDQVDRVIGPVHQYA